MSEASADMNKLRSPLPASRNQIRINHLGVTGFELTGDTHAPSDSLRPSAMLKSPYEKSINESRPRARRRTDRLLRSVPASQKPGWRLQPSPSRSPNPSESRRVVLMPPANHHEHSRRNPPQIGRRLASRRGILAPPPGMDRRPRKVPAESVNRFQRLFLSRVVLHYRFPEYFRKWQIIRDWHVA